MNFTVYKPLKGHDEDAPPYADDKILVVCDGLGGGGQNRYLYKGEYYTSAYLGSRELSKLFRGYCLRNYDEICENMQNPCKIISGLKIFIKESLKKFAVENNFRNVVRGKSMQVLPSTLVSAVYKITEECVETLIISAGDSRAYLLTPDKGLQQLSIDDIADGLDAYSKSATMTNNISENNEFHINYAYYKLPKNCILFVASDGCFDHISTPMDWEYILETAVLRCGNRFSEKNVLGDVIGKILEGDIGLRDDCTIAGMINGFSDVYMMMRDFNLRGNRLYRDFVEPFQKIDKETDKARKNVTSKVKELERQISEKKSKIYNRLANSVRECMYSQCEIYPYRIQKTIKSRLEKLPAYENIFSLFEFENEKRNVERKKAERNYKQQREQLENVFFDIEVEKYMSNMMGKISKIFNSDAVFGIERPVEILRKHIDNINRYKESEEKFKESYSVLLNFVKEGYNVKVEAKYSMTLDFYRWISDYETVCASIAEAENAKNELTENYRKGSKIKNDFDLAYNNEFNAYRKHKRYNEIMKFYELCKELEFEIKNNEPLGKEEKRKIVDKYLNDKMEILVDSVFQEEDILLQLCFHDYEEWKSLNNELETKKSEMIKSDEEKRKIWFEYKKTYERFADCDIKGMV